MTDNRPPKSDRSLKRGDMREGGDVFLVYSATSLNGEMWGSREQLDDLRKRERTRYIRDREKILAKAKRDYPTTKPKKVSYMNTYIKCRRLRDPDFKMKTNMRARLHKAVKNGGGIKNCGTMDMVGCSLADLRAHLENQFTEGMTWDTYGRFGWHIDHIKPCAKFDLTLDSEQKLCFHYTNLQPLWAADNISKGAKY